MEKTEKVMEKVMENHGIFCNLKSTNDGDDNDDGGDNADDVNY